MFYKLMLHASFVVNTSYLLVFLQCKL